MICDKKSFWISYPQLIFSLKTLSVKDFKLFKKRKGDGNDGDNEGDSDDDDDVLRRRRRRL